MGPKYELKPAHPHPVSTLIINWIAQQLLDRRDIAILYVGDDL
jgi:hypothetical protein